MQLHTMSIFGTYSYWQLGEIAGREAAWDARKTPNTQMPEFDPSCHEDYIAGFECGWADSQYTIPVVAHDRHGPIHAYVIGERA